MAMERWSGPTIESTRDSISKIKNMELEHSTGRMEENTTEPGKMENSTEEDSTTSLQDKKR